MDPTDLTISEAAAAIRRGDTTALAYADALLARADKAASLNAFSHLDPSAVRAAARAADAKGAAGGPLHGVPLALKDNLDTADMPTTGGTPGLKGHRPKRNAQVVQKLLDAGAIAFGKANLHELAYGITNNNAGFGAARNPYDPTRIPGGSSGGVGAAVGARIVPGGIGSDTGGSVRVPAALCGIVGFRPTTGRWSQAGVVPISHTRDTPGPMTRSVADCALLDSVVTGSAAPSAAASLKGLRLGVPRAHFWSPLDDETARLMEGVLARLKDAGAVLVEADIADVGRLDAEAGFPIALYETVTDLDAYLSEHGSPLRYAELVAQCASPDVAGLLQSLHGEAAIPEAAYRHALDVLRPQLQAAYRDHFRAQRIEAVVFPTTPLPAAPIGDDETVALNGERVPTFFTFIRNSSPGSVAGIPGISLPAAITAAGLPLGLELDAAEGADSRLLEIALAVERVLPKLPVPNTPRGGIA